MPSDRKVVYLADLTHTGPVISSNVHPLAVGLIGAYLCQEFNDCIKVELFKYPQDLTRALDECIPDVLGFSHYSWNSEISHAYARALKARCPGSAVIFGGPNYGSTNVEASQFWERRPAVDFVVAGEGELAMAAIVGALLEHDMDVEALKATRPNLPNTHYMVDDELIQGGKGPRIKDIAVMPSPYLMGMMDKFFDGKLTPMIQTTRGCPFSCTFCTEGDVYYSKVSKRRDIFDELEYIAERIGDVPELHLSDSNFGEYKEDLGKAEQIRKVIDKYDWPKHIQVDGAKMSKERLLECATIVKGRISVTAALQTTNNEILDTIKHQNISIDKLMHTGRGARDLKVRSYIELILGLPGETKEVHIKSLRDAVMSGVPTVRMYQLILLPNTLMNSAETRSKHGFKPQYRLMPRSYGRYTILGKSVNTIEYEEIITETGTLSFEDYLDCRELHLTVEMIHNEDVFQELRALCSYAGVDWFDVLLGFYSRSRQDNPVIKKIYDTFRDDNLTGLWNSREGLMEHVNENMDEYLVDTSGTNEISKSKALAWFTAQKEIHEAMYEEVATQLESKGGWAGRLKPYLNQLKTLSLLRKRRVLDTSDCIESQFDFDFPALIATNFNGDPMEHLLDNPIECVIRHDDEQASLIDGFVHAYGTSVDGLGRILMLAPVPRMYRGVERKNIVAAE